MSKKNSLKILYWIITIIGFTLSPITFGDDFYSNIPLALLFTYMTKNLTNISPIILLPIMYIITNIIGIIMFVYGISQLKKYGLSKKAERYFQKFQSKKILTLNYLSRIKKKYYYSLIFFLFSLISYYYLDSNPISIFISIIGMLSILMLINIPSEWLEDGFAAISFRLKISAVFAGGLFLAVASSSTEFFTSLSGVVIHKIFSIGFDTLIWSSLFNLCIIIGVCTFYKPKIFISKKLIIRDLPFYGLTIILLLILAIDGKYTPLDFMLLILLYIIYVIMLYFDKSQPYKTDTNDSKNTVSLKIIFGLVIIGILAHFLVSFGQKSVYLIDKFYNYSLPIGILACTLYGPGTSIADLFVSIAATKKGEDSAAIVNTISSNTFDLTICLAVPGLIYSYITGHTIEIDLNNSLLLISMLILSFIIVFFVLIDRKITKNEGIILIIYYVLCTIIYIHNILST